MLFCKRSTGFKKSHPIQFRTKTEIFEFIDSQKGQERMSVMCRLYSVTRSGYYAWKKRGPSQRRQRDAELRNRIREIHKASRGTYGSPRIHKVLKGEGEAVGKKRIARLMRESNLKARSAKLYRSNPGTRVFYYAIPNRQLDKAVTGPNEVWVGDITYLKFGRHWRYLAVVMDKYSRRIIGWSLSSKKDMGVTLSALNRAVFNRRPNPGVIFHTDRGIEYSAYGFRDRLARLGFIQSMNRPWKMTDNAHMESFFHSMKSDVIHGRKFDTEKQIKEVVKSYIPFYNRLAFIHPWAISHPWTMKCA